jgi:hypothetical protein
MSIAALAALARLSRTEFHIPEFPGMQRGSHSAVVLGLAQHVPDKDSQFPCHGHGHGHGCDVLAPAPRNALKEGAEKARAS